MSILDEEKAGEQIFGKNHPNESLETLNCMEHLWKGERVLQKMVIN